MNQQNNKKINICLLFGGRSGEHEVSLLSAKSIYEALDQEKYKVTLVGIDKNGHWKLSKDATFLLNSNDPDKISLDPNTPEVQTSAKGEGVIIETLENKQEVSEIDVFFPIMHGTYGEDGCIQGFLELLNIAYVGADVLGSAVGMDKDIMKRLLRDAGLPIGRFATLYQPSVVNSDLRSLQAMVDDLGRFPVFVKPANSGSSVGISKAHNEQELVTAIKFAMQYDTKVLIEEYIAGREIECSVLGAGNPRTSLPGEIIPANEFYDYEAKYLLESGLKIPAELSEQKISEVQQLTVEVFKTLNCYGLARVDFFLTEEGKFYVNEINTLPGFTKSSMYPKMWEASGLPYSKLLDELITLAIERKKQKDTLKRTYK